MLFSTARELPQHGKAKIPALLTLTLVASAVGFSPQLLAAPAVAQSVKIDERVYEIVFNPTTDAVYAAVTGERPSDTASNKDRVTAGIVVLDAKTLEQVDKIATGETTPFGLSINTKTQKLYAVDTPKGQVAVYAIDSGKEVALIESKGKESKHLRQAVVDEQHNKIYISAVGGNSRDGRPGPKSAIWVIDGATDQLESVILEPVPTAAGLALDADNQRLYVSDLSGNNIAEVDLATQEVVRTFASSAESDAQERANTINLEIDTKNGILFAINQKSGGVTLIDIKSGDIISTVKTGSGALSARLHPQSGDLYVANRGDGTVSIIDADNYFVSAHLASGTHPQTIAIDPKTGQVYVSNKSKGKGRNAAKEAPTPFEPAGNTITLITP